MLIHIYNRKRMAVIKWNIMWGSVYLFRTFWHLHESSKDQEWTAKAPRVGLLNTYCAGKRLLTVWPTKLSILKKTHRAGTLRLCHRSHLTLPPLNWLTRPTTRSSNNRWEVAADIQTGKLNIYIYIYIYQIELFDYFERIRGNIYLC